MCTGTISFPQSVHGIVVSKDSEEETTAASWRAGIMIAPDTVLVLTMLITMKNQSGIDIPISDLFQVFMVVMTMMHILEVSFLEI
mgnify:CR=1 FL=1